ncbi:Ferric iron reductase FhuF-like transporter [Actinopolymorpha cephalotaxi]|uniref:Ferric iron reductase FhuF-like transporter n=1 Tax=Actinopolymorpha cephalotaxi TaxID=504797 RepID=A0A1I3BML2_9ACTN|nr:Ferric iron reductase FhuF-like transporter [Actinopolymorpha cephalotaxi]
MSGGRSVRDLLADAGTIGAYFTVSPFPVSHFTVSPEIPGAPPRDLGLVSLAQLYAGHATLGRAITHMTERLGTTEVRVGASILFQGMAARLWSPVVAVALLHRRVPVLAPESTWPDLGASPASWRTDPERVTLLDPADNPGEDPDEHQAEHPSERPDNDVDRLARLVVRTVVKTHLTPLTDAVRAELPIPGALLWGNAASALVGTLGVLARSRPGLAHEVSVLTATALRQPPLADAGTLDSTQLSPGDTGPPAFVRRSCCLYYRVPGGGLCGDCALTRRP